MLYDNTSMSLLDLFIRPHRAIQDARGGTLVEALVIAALSAFIFALGPLIIALTGGMGLPLGGVKGAVFIFIGVIGLSLFLGAIAHLTMTTLGGAGGYADGVYSIDFLFAPASAGVLFSLLIARLALALSQITALLFLIIGLAVAVFTLFGALGAAAMYRSLATLYETHLIAAFIAGTIVYTIVSLVITVASTILPLLGTFLFARTASPI